MSTGAPSSQIQPRDQRVLRWVAGWRHVAASQVHRWLGIRQHVNPTGRQPSMTVVYRRLAALRDHGLLTVDRPMIGGAQRAYRITRGGLDLVGLHDWWAPTYARTLHGHQHAVVSSALDQLADGAQVISERAAKQDHRIRSQGRPGYAGWGIDMGHRASARGPHWPDFWIRRNGEDPERRGAVELELSAKDSGRLRDILRGYQLAGEHGRCDALIYLSHDRSVLEAVAEQARAIGIPVEGRDDPSEVPPPLLMIRDWEPADGQ